MEYKKPPKVVRAAPRSALASRWPLNTAATRSSVKSVHFDHRLEHIRHFLPADEPQAVSTDLPAPEVSRGDCDISYNAYSRGCSSAEVQIFLGGLTSDASRVHQPVRLSSLTFSPQKNVLLGLVTVANVAFHKHVMARFTFDRWYTVCEVPAKYQNRNGQGDDHHIYDIFSFEIDLNDQVMLDEKTLSLCIRYNVNGQEYWDNNHGRNYHVRFVFESTITQPPPPSAEGPSASSYVSRSCRPYLRLSPDNMPKTDNNTFPNTSEDQEKRRLRDKNKIDKSETLPLIHHDRHIYQRLGNRYDLLNSLIASMHAKTRWDKTLSVAQERFHEQPNTHYHRALDQESESCGNDTSHAAGSITSDLAPFR